MKYNKILIKQDGAHALPEVGATANNELIKKEFERLQKGFRNESDPDGKQSFGIGFWKAVSVINNLQAPDNAVKFRDDDYKYILLFGLGVSNEIVYDCPEGFEIVIENGYATLKNIN
jgi:hypothetical protein